MARIFFLVLFFMQRAYSIRFSFYRALVDYTCTVSSNLSFSPPYFETLRWLVFIYVYALVIPTFVASSVETSFLAIPRQ